MWDTEGTRNDQKFVILRFKKELGFCPHEG